MQADWSIELGPEDEALELPWAAPENGLQYYDLKRHPELLRSIPEAQGLAELADFLAAVNAESTVFETAKCDTWLSDEMTPEDEVFACPLKFGSYIDLAFSEPRAQTNFSRHEILMKRVVEHLQLEPEIPASAELLLRRCFYLRGEKLQQIIDGFYITMYIFGFAENETAARQHWAQALLCTQRALTDLGK